MTSAEAHPSSSKSVQISIEALQEVRAEFIRRVRFTRLDSGPTILPMLPWQVDAEVAVFLEDHLILPSLELLDHAYERNWISTRHFYATANLQDAPITNTQQRSIVYEIQLRIVKGYLKDRLQPSAPEDPEE